MSKLFEAFKAISSMGLGESTMNEKAFEADKEGIEEMEKFVDVDENGTDDNDFSLRKFDDLDEVEVFDDKAPFEEEKPEDHTGQAILECSICHSNIFRNKDEVEVNEEGTLADEGKECPYCGNPDGYYVVGMVEPFTTGEEKEETEEETEVEDGDEKVDVKEKEEVEESLTESKDCEECKDSSCEDKKKGAVVEAVKSRHICKDNSLEEDTQAANVVNKYQEWVDYDMKKYGKISNITKGKLDKAGFEVVKDDHGDYEVIAKDKKELGESKLNELFGFGKRRRERQEWEKQADQQQKDYLDKLNAKRAEDARLEARRKAIDDYNREQEIIKKSDKYLASLAKYKDTGSRSSSSPSNTPYAGINYSGGDYYPEGLFEADGDENTQPQGEENSSGGDEEQFAKLVQELRGKKNYAEFVTALQQLNANQKKLFMKFFGKADSFKVDPKTAIQNIPCTDLYPTQSEIDYVKSLEGPLKGGCKQFFTNPIKFGYKDEQTGKQISTPVLVYKHSDGKYWIIDGHHRWSKAYMFNPTGNVQCQVFQYSAKSPVDALKDFQASVLAASGQIKVGKAGTNIYAISDEDLKSYISSNMSDACSNDIISAQKANSKESAVDYVTRNGIELKNKNRPVSGAPDRKLMPQTDTKSVQIAASGVTDMGESLKNIMESFDEIEVKLNGKTLKVSQTGNSIKLDAQDEDTTTEDTTEVVGEVSETDADEMVGEDETTEDTTEDETTGEEEEVNVDEVDTETMDQANESYLKENYSNVRSYRTTSVREVSGKLVVEGLITFKSGAKKKTQFIYESHSKKGDKLKFIGENKQIANGKKAFRLNTSIRNGKVFTESLNYKYTVKQNGKSAVVSGTARANKK